MNKTPCYSFINGLNLLLFGLVAVDVVQAAPPVAPARHGLLGKLKLPAGARPAGDLEQMLRGLRAGMASEPWKPQVNEEVARDGADVYAKVAPAVVVVRTDQGHGTGFIVHPASWIVTNHHVIADTASTGAACKTAL